MSWWRTTPVVLGAVALGLANCGHAADLFLPVDPRPNAAPAAKSSFVGWNTAPDAWERRVRVARYELATARADVESAGAGRLLLNVRSGVLLDVVVERTASTSGGFSLSGRVASPGAGFVTLVVHEEAVAGSIWTPDSAYELTYLGGGVHALWDVTNVPLECGNALPNGGLSDSEATAQGGTDDGSVVDILVVWTPEAEERYGGGEAVFSRIEMLIAYANDAFERSGAFVSLNLVEAEKIEYAEADSATDLARLADLDGHMDRIHDRRNVLSADLIYLLTSRWGGRAVRGGAFSVGAGHAPTFAHEVGHNFGIGHERHEFIGGWTMGYSHGFTTEGCDRTIMSYGTKCFWRGGAARLPFYASPWRYNPRDGRPFGVARFSKERGARGPADAVLTLNRNRHRIANLRPSRNGGEP